MNIPKQVSELANRNGFNSIVLSKQSQDESIYAVGCVDENGFSLPIGLPSFIVVKCGSCQLVTGLEGLSLADTLFGDE